MSTPAPKVVVFPHSGDYVGPLGAEHLAAKGAIDGWVGWSAILQRTATGVDRFYRERVPAFPTRLTRPAACLR